MKSAYQPQNLEALLFLAGAGRDSDWRVDDQNGHFLTQNQPLVVCDKTARALAALGRDDIHISVSAYFYDGGRCC